MPNLNDPLTDDEKGTIAMALMHFGFGGPPEMLGAFLQMTSDIADKLGIRDQIMYAEKFITEQSAAVAGHGRRRGR